MTTTRTVDEKNALPSFPLNGTGPAFAAEGKLRLRTRQTAIEDELRGIPERIGELHLRSLLLRQRGAEATYQLTLALLKLQTLDPKFYTRYGCKRLEVYLVKYDLGNGKRLARRIHLVKLFEPETFALIGEELLEWMIEQVVKARQGSGASNPSDVLKPDIKRIFARYGDEHAAFTPDAFQSCIRAYLKERYPARAPAPPPRPSGDGARPRASPATAAKPPAGVTAPKATCTGCAWRDQVIRDYETYLSQVVMVIRQLRGAYLLDDIAIPEQLTAYRRQHFTKRS